MASENLGASFSIDITDLKAGLTQANRLIRESESEFKASAAGLDDWTKSSDGVTARLKYLTQATDLQEKKVEALNKEYERLIKEGLDPLSSKAVRLRTDINKEVAALEKNRKEIDKQVDVLKELSDESDKSSKSVKNLSKEAKESGDGFTIAKGAIANFIADGLTAIVSKAGEAVNALLGLSDATREYRSSIATLETNAKRTGVSTEVVSEAMKDLSGIVDDTDTSVEALSNLLQAGFDDKSLGTAVETLSNAVVAFPDTLKIESLADGLQESMMAMENGGKATGAYAELLERLGYDLSAVKDQYEKLSTDEEKQAYLLGLVNKELKGNADAYREQNKDLVAAKEAQFEYNEALADLGGSFEPLDTALTNFKTGLLEDFMPALQSIGEELVNVFEGEEGATEKFVTSISDMLTQAITKIITVQPQFTEMATQLILQLVDILPMVTSTAVEIIGTLINGISSTLPTLIPTLVDAVILMAETLIDNVDMVIDAGIELILGLAYGLIEAVPRLIDKIPVIINKLVTELVSATPKLISAGIELLVALGSGLVVAIPKLVGSIPQIWAAIIGGFMDGLSDIKNVGKNIIEGLWEGITSMGDWISQKLKGFGDGVLSSIKNFFGIHSPSAVFRDEIGKNLALGIGEGFEKNIKGVNKTMVKSMKGLTADMSIEASSPSSVAYGGGGVVINQTNNYSTPHSHYEIVKNKQQTLAAVKLAVRGEGLYAT